MSLILIAAALVCCAAPAGGPIALHPGNPHYFTWRGEPTVLVTSGEHYGVLLNLDFDYEVYFRELARHGLNHTRVFSGTYRENPGAFGITENTLAPKPTRYVGPWAPAAGQEGRFDLTQWNPAYFERLHGMMKAADRHGVVVEMTLFCTFYEDASWESSPMCAKSNVNGVGDCPRGEALNLSHEDLTKLQVRFARKMARELNPYGNLYFEVCNEPYIDGYQCVSREWQDRIVQAIVRAEQGLPNRHLISLNIANGRERVETRPPDVSIFNFHYAYPPDAVAINYDHGVVIGENETGFRRPEDVFYRTEAWDFLLAGGALFNNLDYSFVASHPDGSLVEYTSPGGGSAALREQLGVLKRFVDGLDFIHMRPDTSFIREAPGLRFQALAQEGQTYAACFHAPLPGGGDALPAELTAPRTAEVRLSLPAGTYAVQWVSTRTGEALHAATLAHEGGETRLSSPQFETDIALLLTR